MGFTKFLVFYIYQDTQSIDNGKLMVGRSATEFYCL